MINKKLKPVVYVKGRYNYHRQNLFQQNLLLRALQVTVDPIKLRDLAGFRTVTEVYRTLDKMSLRKEYHEALAMHGMDLDTIVGGIKEICFNAPSSSTRLAGYQILLRSLGLDEYRESLVAEKAGWEESLLKYAEKRQLEENPVMAGEYEVIVPDIPQDEKEKEEKEMKIGKSLYE